jgi:hypothetical protein
MVPPVVRYLTGNWVPYLPGMRGLTDPLSRNRRGYNGRRTLRSCYQAYRAQIRGYALEFTNSRRCVCPSCPPLGQVDGREDDGLEVCVGFWCVAALGGLTNEFLGTGKEVGPCRKPDGALASWSRSLPGAEQASMARDQRRCVDLRDPHDRVVDQALFLL